MLRLRKRTSWAARRTKQIPDEHDIRLKNNSNCGKKRGFVIEFAKGHTAKLELNYLQHTLAERGISSEEGSSGGEGAEAV